MVCYSLQALEVMVITIEKLTVSFFFFFLFGRKRTLVAIGTHDLDTLQGPFTYEVN